VRLIYRLFLYGKSPSFIASLLTDEGFPTPGGKTKWRPNVIISILTNEKMKGDAKLQKRFTIDFLNKKVKMNEGEVPQYYVHDSHPAIIEPGLFDLVQFEMKRRQQSGKWSSSAHPFSGKIFCGECGGMYGPRVWNSTSEYRRAVWQCNEKYAGGTYCVSPHLTDSQIQTAFLAAFNDRLDNKAEIFEAYDEVLRALTDNSALDAEATELKNELEVVMELTRKAVQENATVALDQGEYRQRFTGLEKRYAAANARLAEIDETRLERSAERTNITRFLKTLVRQGDDLVTEFDEELWYITVDIITVQADGRLVVTFRDGFEVSIAADIWKAA